MNRKILGVVVSFIAVAMLASPVLAIGPINAPEDNNPNIDFPNYGVALNLPSGVFHEWVQQIGKHLTYKDAAKFKIKNADFPEQSNSCRLLCSCGRSSKIGV